MTVLQFLAPAKINLCLRILDSRVDGYHNLSMLMEKVSLYDEITLEEIPEGIELFEVRGSRFQVPKEENLAYRAAKLLQEESRHYNAGGQAHTSWGVRIKLTKKILMGSGLGGGSSDAATVLRGLNQLWDLNWSTQKLAELGVKLGADVPFFIYDGPAKVEGIGDLITPLEKLPKLWIILINPGVHVATPWAYSIWDAKRSPLMASDALEGGRNNLTQENQSVRRLNTFSEVIQVLHNDFETVVIPEYPEIQTAKESLLKAGAKGALMSGSGSTVFGLFETKEARDRALGKVETRPAWQMFSAESL